MSHRQAGPHHELDYKIAIAYTVQTVLRYGLETKLGGEEVSVDELSVLDRVLDSGVELGVELGVEEGEDEGVEVGVRVLVRVSVDSVLELQSVQIRSPGKCVCVPGGSRRTTLRA